MYTVEEFLKLEEKPRLYDRKDNIIENFKPRYRPPQSAKELYDHLKKMYPDYNLNEVFPIYCYISQLRGNYFSKLVNYYHENYEKDLYAYFSGWLNLSLHQLESYRNDVYHHIQISVFFDMHVLYKQFNQLKKQEIIVKKFLSCSKIRWPGNSVTFIITPLAPNSYCKDVTSLPGKNNSLGEQELIFNINATFIVNDIVLEDNDKYLIYLTETNASKAFPKASYFRQNLSFIK